MGKIQVLHVTSTPRGIGGVERLLVDVARHYDLSRFDVAHCNLFDETGGEGPFPSALKATGLPLFAVHGRHWRHIPSMVRELLALIRREKIDLLHLHMVHATIIGGLVGLFSPGTRVVVSKHYTYEMLPSRIVRAIDRLFTNRADAIAAVSEFVRTDLLAHGAARAKTRVIHNGTDLDAFDRLSSEESDDPLTDASGLIIGCVGNFHPRKGHEYLIRAMPEITRKFRSARLFLWGEGNERQALERLSKSLGVAHAVMTPGFVTNVPAMLKHVDVFVQPSLEEAFGISILEAMAARKCVVATDVDGIPEIVVDRVTGMLVPPRNPKAIANAVCTLLGSADQRGEMGGAGRARVAQEFDIRKTARAYEQLYSSLVQ